MNTFLSERLEKKFDYLLKNPISQENITLYIVTSEPISNFLKKDQIRGSLNPYLYSEWESLLIINILRGSYIKTQDKGKLEVLLFNNNNLSFNEKTETTDNKKIYFLSYNPKI